MKRAAILLVIPAQAGIQFFGNLQREPDSRLRGNDGLSAHCRVRPIWKN
jgi:hypothetical protein